MAEMQTGCLSSKLAMNHLPSHPLSGGSEIEIPLASSDPRVPLYNLSVLDRRIDTLRRFLSRSLETRASIGDDQIDLVSKEIASSVQHIILNGAALLGTSQNQNLQRDLGGWTASIAEDASDLFAEKVNELTTVKSMMPPDLRDLTGESRKPADLKKSFHSDSRNLTTPADQGALAVGDGNLVDLKVLEKSINSRKLRGNMAEPLLPYLDSGNMKVPADQGIPAAGDGNLLEKSGDSRYFSENIADHKIPVCSDSKILKITADQVFSGAADGNLFDLKFPEDSRTSRKLRNPADGNRLEEDDDDAGAEIIELDSVELLAEHMHFCEICGKGFKRDANLRMHKRAHGNQFKTLEALSKPDRSGEDHGRKIRFSCPFEGCNRNKSHKRFRPLKSAVCVKNHFKRSHCPKMYSCNRCNKKSFSVVSDLKSHLKHCGESRWRCSCGTTFSRKDKLFGHVALFEGHMPAIVGEEKSTAGVDLEDEMQVDREGHAGTADSEASNSDLFEGLLQGFGAVDASSLNDLLGFV